MQVRLASYRDLSQVDDLYRATEVADPDLLRRLQAAGPHSPVPGPGLARAWYIVNKSLSALVPLADPADQLYVAEERGRIVGFIQAEPAPGGRAWQILNLCLAPDAPGPFVAGPLIEQLFAEGQGRGVTRFLVRLPAEHPLEGILRAQGFTPYATEQIRFRELPAPPSDDPGPWIPARAEDLAGIHALYLRTAPHAVAAIEAPSIKVWRTTFQLGWLSRIQGRGSDGRHYVIDRGHGLVAWAGLRLPARARPAMVGMMLDPQEGELAVEAVHGLLNLLPRGPTLSVLRHYDGELVRAIEARGFEAIAAQLLMVRDLPIRLRARGRPHPQRPPLAGALPVVHTGPPPALAPHGCAGRATLRP